MGALLGIILVLPFVDGTVPFLHGSGRSQAFLPSAVFYAAGTVLSLFLMRGISPSSRSSNSAPLAQLYRQTRGAARETTERKNIWYFLLGLFLFADAILTIENNASYYLVDVMQYSENAKAALFALLLVMAALGALLSVKLAQRIRPQKLLIGILVAWAVTLLLVSVTRRPTSFALLFAIVGLLFGSQAAVARAFFLTLLPPDRAGQYFGIFASFQRFANCIGPLVWVGVACRFHSRGTDAYRLSMVAMAMLICMGIAFIYKISEPAPQTA